MSNALPGKLSGLQGEMWPVLDLSDPDTVDIVRSRLSSFWQSRLEQGWGMPHGLNERIGELDRSSARLGWPALGFEMVESALRAKAVAFFCLDLPGAGMAQILAGLIGKDAAQSAIDGGNQEDLAGNAQDLVAVIRAIWADGAPGAGLEGAHRLARYNLAGTDLWGAGVVGGALIRLATQPAEDALAGLDVVGPRGTWLGVISYLRGRILTSLKDSDVAAKEFIAAIDISPSFFVRYLCDPALRGESRVIANVTGAVDSRIADFRMDLLGWQRSRGDRLVRDDFRHIEWLLSLGQGGYGPFTAGAFLRDLVATGSYVPNPVDIQSRVDGLRRSLTDIGGRCRLSVSADGRFWVASAKSQIEALSARVLSPGRSSDDVLQFQALEAQIPRILAVAVHSYALRVQECLFTCAKILGDHEIAVECVRIAAEIDGQADACVALLNDSDLPTIERYAAQVFRAIDHAVDRWKSAVGAHHGAASASLAQDGPVLVSSAGFTALRLNCTRHNGQPFVGGAAFFEIISGPARFEYPDHGLADIISPVQATGRIFCTLNAGAGEVGESGVVKVTSPWFPSFEIPYVIVA